MKKILLACLLTIASSSAFAQYYQVPYVIQTQSPMAAPRSNVESYGLGQNSGQLNQPNLTAPNPYSIIQPDMMKPPQYLSPGYENSVKPVVPYYGTAQDRISLYHQESTQRLMMQRQEEQRQETVRQNNILRGMQEEQMQNWMQGIRR